MNKKECNSLKTVSCFWFFSSVALFSVLSDVRCTCTKCEKSIKTKVRKKNCHQASESDVTVQVACISY